MNITLENLSDDKLHKEVWSFYFCDSFFDKPILYLDSYQILERESTKKHNWEIIKQYQRLGRQRDWINCTIKSEDVPMDTTIENAIKEKFYSQLQVKLWDKK